MQHPSLRPRKILRHLEIRGLFLERDLVKVVEGEATDHPLLRIDDREVMMGRAAHDPDDLAEPRLGPERDHISRRAEDAADLELGEHVSVELSSVRLPSWRASAPAPGRASCAAQR